MNIYSLQIVYFSWIRKNIFSRLRDSTWKRRLSCHWQDTVFETNAWIAIQIPHSKFTENAYKNLPRANEEANKWFRSQISFTEQHKQAETLETLKKCLFLTFSARGLQDSCNHTSSPPAAHTFLKCSHLCGREHFYRVPIECTHHWHKSVVLNFWRTVECPQKNKKKYWYLEHAPNRFRFNCPIVKTQLLKFLKSP